MGLTPGSLYGVPPEREKLTQVAQLLSKRPQLKLSVPGQYSEAADGALHLANRIADAQSSASGAPQVMLIDPAFVF